MIPSQPLPYEGFDSDSLKFSIEPVQSTNQDEEERYKEEALEDLLIRMDLASIITTSIKSENDCSSHIIPIAIALKKEQWIKGECSYEAKWINIAISNRRADIRNKIEGKRKVIIEAILRRLSYEAYEYVTEASNKLAIEGIMAEVINKILGKKPATGQDAVGLVSEMDTSSSIEQNDGGDVNVKIEIMQY